MKNRTLSAFTAFSLALSIPAALSMPSAMADTRDIVSTAMTELMINKNTAIIDELFAEPYIQHNQLVPSGVAGLKGLADQAIAQNPAFGYEMVRFFVDGDVGITHGIYRGFGPDPLVAFDIFRVENDKIVEHWDNLQPVAAPNPSGRSQTDGATEIVDLDRTDDNKALVRDFVDTVLINGAFDQLNRFIDGNNYLQHNSDIADGQDGLAAGFAALADAGTVISITKLHAIYGEGNFVLALSEGDISGTPTAFYDLFRVENGKLAEHWDVISPILPEADAANPNGKF